jgi:thiamine biosynthesis protein ThiI
LPYDDCCSIFTPRRPRTKPNITEVLKAEEMLDIDVLVKEAIEGIERIKV